MSYPGDGVGNGKTLTEFLSGIRGRLAAATPGPWRAVRNNGMGETWFNIFAHNDDNVLAMIGDLADKIKKCPNAALIASSPTDLALAVEVIEIQAKALELANHAIANAWEWQMADPEDYELDSNQQVGNWCEKGCGGIKEALAKIDALLKENVK